MRKLLTRLAMKVLPETKTQEENLRLRALLGKVSELSFLQEEEIHILRKRLGLAFEELNKLRAASISEVDKLIGEMRR